MLDPDTRLPVPPLDAVVNQGLSNGITVFFTALLAAAVVYALNDWRRSGRPTLLLVLAGGGLTFLVEPYVDVVGGCWHPEIGQDTVITLLGRPMPLWLLPTYFVYFGAQTMLAYRVFHNGLTRRQLWLAFLLPVASDIVLEETLMHWDQYYYYGNQPLLLIKFPLWWAPTNSLGVLAAVLLNIAAVPRLTGWARMAIPLITPLAYAGMFSVVALPAVTVINSGFSRWATQVGGLATVALAFAVVHALTRIVARDSLPPAGSP